MKKALVLVIAALVLPSVALAARPAATGGKGNPKVSYILKGSLSAYTAYNPVGPVAGSITIKVSSANYHGKALKGMTLTFATDAKTAVVLHKHKPIADGDIGTVKIRALKKIAAADLAATLQLSTAKQIVDMGAPKAPKH
jgi:hypothetical protein